MYLRRNRRKKKGETYEYWTLVESVRTANGPRQRIVANIGKEPGLDEDERYGWEDIARLLDGEDEAGANGQTDMFTPSRPELEKPFWVEANLSKMRVERLREFGKPYVSLALWRRLRLHQFFQEHMPRGKERIGWDQVAFILSCGRFCEQASELALAERWYANTALEDLLDVPVDAIYDNRLYRGLDELLGLREPLFRHLRERYESMFGSRFEFLLYDITSTYFEGQCTRNPQAQRGYSRDSRPDCKQVCIGLVVTPEGLPLAYEVFEGNPADVTTVEDIVEVKLIEHPDGQGTEQYVLCRSEDRASKERAMLEKQRQRLRQKLEQIHASLCKRPQDPEKIGRRIGRWLGRNTIAEKIFSVDVKTNHEGKACALEYREDESKCGWAAQAHGAYLLRTNCLDKNPESLWRWYIQLTQAEDAFRCCKSDLGMRPVFHHIEERVQAHIMVCFLSLVMWRCFEMQMKACGLGDCARQALIEIERIRSMDVIVPTKNDTEVHVRVVSKPDDLAVQLLQKLGLKLPNRPKIIQNVVEKMDSK